MEFFKNSKTQEERIMKLFELFGAKNLISLKEESTKRTCTTKVLRFMKELSHMKEKNFTRKQYRSKV